MMVVFMGGLGTRLVVSLAAAITISSKISISPLWLDDYEVRLAEEHNIGAVSMITPI